MSAYGDFLTAFPELMKTYRVWTSPDMSDERTIKGVYMTTKGGGIKRQKYTSSNTSLDNIDSDDLYVRAKYENKISVGDYFKRPRHLDTYRVVKDKGWDEAAAYHVYGVERVTGATPDKDQPLPVKEGLFA